MGCSYRTNWGRGLESDHLVFGTADQFISCADRRIRWRCDSGRWISGADLRCRVVGRLAAHIGIYRHFADRRYASWAAVDDCCVLAFPTRLAVTSRQILPWPSTGFIICLQSLAWYQ